MNRIMSHKGPTTLGYALLGLLHQQPRSGYALRKVFETTPMGHYSSSPGAIYPALRRLEDRKLVAASVDRTQKMRPKKILHVTRKGVKTLRSWVSRGVSREDIIWRSEELMLRFGFMSGLVDVSVTVGFLQRFARESEAYVEELEAHLASFPPETPLHGRLALEAGIRGYTTQARWALDALKRFRKAERSRRKR